MSNGLGEELELALAACRVLSRLCKDESIRMLPHRVIDSAIEAGHDAFDKLEFYFQSGEGVVPADVLLQVAQPVLRMIDEALGKVVVDVKFEHVRLLAQRTLHELAHAWVEFKCSVEYVDDDIEAGVDDG